MTDTPVPKPKPNAPVALKGTAALDRFLRLTGLERSVVDGQNDRTLTFITTTGGKYQMNRRGTNVRIISGPEYPKYVPGSQEG